MQPFLDKVAEHLYANYKNNLDNVVIVLPNKRASLFLKTHLSSYFDKTVWLPKITSSEELVLEFTGLKKLDNISLLFRFYNVYKEIIKEDAETFDEFMLWGQVVLQDFNEIDQYLIDSNDLFSFINEARALEVWNVDGSEITDTQRNYLEFWKKLPIYYNALRQKLKDNNECYQGISFRFVAEHITEIYQEQNLDKINQFLFVGFNALNKSEEKIIDFLVRNKKASLLWDGDSYYLNNKSQEAGLFLRRFRKKWDFKEFLWETDNWKTSEKRITITGVNGDVSQAQFVGDILSSEPEGSDFKNTVVTLADEMLLEPVLQALPDNVDHVNVTMGYSLENSPMHSLWLSLIKMHENALKYSGSDKANTYHFRDVIQLLNHPFIKSKEVNKVVAHIIKFNWVFITQEKIINHVGDSDEKLIFEICFTSWNDNPMLAIKQLKLLAEYYREKWENQDTKEIHKEYLHLYHKIIQNLSDIVKDNIDVIGNVKTIKQLFSQLISKESVDFYGEPLKGLQLMGILETRTLDFEKVVLLSANEGTIPASKSSQSFIPFEIKRKFKLPTHIEKDALFAYHFYRLLQRASDIHLVYNSDVDSFSGSEKSRFITQLQYELKDYPNIKFKEQHLSFDLKSVKPKAVLVNKSEEIIERLNDYLNSGVSPSALNKYLACPLDFYYCYILKLREQDDVEEKIEASTMGTVIHGVLEDIYKPFENKVLKSTDLKGQLKTVEERVSEKFKGLHFTKKELGFGKNYLTLKVIVKFINDFLANEIAFLNELTKSGQSLTILELEKELSAVIEVDGLEVKLKGVADRIDKIGNTIRIIDYKTGVVEPKQLHVKSVEALTQSSDHNKALQLMLYGMMFADTINDNNYKISPGIISFRKLSDGLMNLKIAKEDFSNDYLDEFKLHLGTLISEMKNKLTPFEHDNKAVYCKFCDI